MVPRCISVLEPSSRTGASSSESIIVLQGEQLLPGDGENHLHGVLKRRTVAMPQEEFQVPTLRVVLLEVRVGYERRHRHRGVIRRDLYDPQLGRLPSRMMTCFRRQ